jgi:spermidine synthase
MLKWNLLAETPTPDGCRLGLYEHDGEYVLRVNGRELMSNRRHASELRLGVLGGLAARTPASRVLIGGLGLGYTLRGVLAHAHPQAEVVVAELMPEVVAWNSRTDWPLASGPLADPRTRVAIGDVGALIAEAAAGRAPRYDAILLDADNGTTPMMTEGNRALYRVSGVRETRAALKPGGLGAWWSAAEEPAFAKLLGKEGFRVTIERVRAWGTGGPRHTLLVGQVAHRPPAGRRGAGGEDRGPDVRR